MNKIIPIAAAAVLAAALSLTSVAPAAAYYHGHHGWGGPGIGVGIGAGIIGLAAGAALAGAARDNYDRSDWRDHVDACLDAYRSYNPRTDRYLGTDGYTHLCRL